MCVYVCMVYVCVCVLAANGEGSQDIAQERNAETVYVCVYVSVCMCVFAFCLTRVWCFSVCMCVMGGGGGLVWWGRCVR